MNLTNKKFLAYGMLLGKAIIYGCSIFFVGDLLRVTDVFDVLALRFMLSAIVMTLLIPFGIIKVNYKGKNLKPLILAALFEPVLYFIFETYGVSGTTTSVAGIIVALSPVLTIVFGALILKEQTTLFQKFLILLRIVGAMLVILFAQSDGVNQPRGIICMFIAVASGVFFAIYSRKSSHVFSPFEVTYFTTICGAVVFNMINLVRHMTLYGNVKTYFLPLANTGNLVGFLFLSVLSSIIATMMNNYALGKIQVSHAAAFGGVSTLVTIATGVVFNHEVLAWYHILGAILISVGSFGIVFTKSESKEVL